MTTAPSPDAWRDNLVPGAVVEAWTAGKLSFGRVVDTYEKGAIVEFVEDGALLASAKLSFGEVVSVWPRHLAPGPTASLVADVDAGLRLIRSSRPRSLNLSKVYDTLRQAPRTDPRSRRTSFQLAPKMFPLYMRGPRERRAAATVATAVLLEADANRFKRAGEGSGWRALPPSVAVARSRCSFVDVCKRLLDTSTPARDRAAPWTRDQLEILRELEICAASGSSANGTAATALASLGYEGTDDGAAALLLDIGYWTTGTVERDGGGLTQDASRQAPQKHKAKNTPANFENVSPSDRKKLLEHVKQTMKSNTISRIGSTAFSSQETDADSSQNAPAAHAHSETSSRSEKARWDSAAVGNSTESVSPAASEPRGVSAGRQQSLRDWTFPPQVLAEARDIRLETRERRRRFAEGDLDVRPPRRNLVNLKRGTTPLRVYCVDDSNARFLDDALSIQILHPGKLVRIAVHIADVDETVKSGSGIDELAKERGQSLYLPLKPLHMLPAAAMDAASFSTSTPSEGITAVMDVDVLSGELVFWEVFASLVPPVIRLNYNQFDAVLEDRRKDANLEPEIVRDLQAIAAVAPVLAEKLDTRRSSRKTRRGGSDKLTGENAADDSGSSSSDALTESSQTESDGVSAISAGEAGIASVRLVRRRELGPNAGRTKVAQVVDFRTGGGHSVVGDMLLSVSTLFRQFAYRHGAFLPEDRGAHQYVSRCGTAPMRRYADLAIQRQMKCILFGREPAGRRRMDELRYWLAKRHAAGERTVASRRKTALYESLSDHCAQQRHAGKQPYATLHGRVRNISVLKNLTVRAEISLDGTGLYTTAEVDERVLRSSDKDSHPEETKRDQRLRMVASALRNGDRVRLHVSEVNTVAQRIVSRVVSKVKM